MKICLSLTIMLLSHTLLAATYHVRGECEKDVLSDRASVTVGVTSTDKLAAKAQERSAKTYDALLSKIKAAKLAHEEIQTESIQLYEDFDWIKGKKNSRGFISNMTLRVSTSDFSKLSGLIPSFTEMGATQVGELSLFVSKAMALHREFSKSSLKLEEMKEISSSSYRPPLAIKSAMVMEASDSSVAPSIEGGKQKISVQVMAQFKD